MFEYYGLLTRLFCCPDSHRFYCVKSKHVLTNLVGMFLLCVCVFNSQWLCGESLRTRRVRHPARRPDLRLHPEQKQSLHLRGGQQKVPPGRPETAGVNIYLYSRSQAIIRICCVYNCGPL